MARNQLRELPLRIAAREIEAMWKRRVIMGLMVAALCGCNPFEGTVFELRAPLSPAEQPDPNMARVMEPDEWTGPQSVQEDEWTYVAVLIGGREGLPKSGRYLLASARIRPAGAR